MTRFTTFLAACLAICLTFCLTSTASAQDRPRIVTVNYALQVFTERLLGDTAEVVFPVPKGTDPSFWRPSIADISQIQSADLIVLNGAGFAAWIDRVSLPRARLVDSSAAIKDQFITTQSITHSHGEGGEHSHDATASYLWLDPTLAIAQSEAIAAALAARGIADPDAVTNRLATLRSDLEALDAMAQKALAEAQNTPMIATHPRYQYFARRYGLTIDALEWEAGAMPSTADLADLGARMAKSGASILIWEAEPPAEALEITAKLGLQNVIFPPFARPGTEAPFDTGFAKAVTDISEAVAKVTGD